MASHLFNHSQKKKKEGDAIMVNSELSQAHRFIQTVRQYADRVLQLHQSSSGEEGTPLFADGFNVETLEPVQWHCEGQEWTLSNLASQQNWLRLLCALSQLTGDDRYRSTAADTVSYAFKHLRYGRLLKWGGHMAYDLSGKQYVFAPDKGPQHELKCHYPFYELMNEVDRDETRAYIEAFWDSHVVNWANLEFSRHGKPVEEPEIGTVWDREFEGGAPFFTGVGLTFINAGSDLYYAAGMLNHFTGDDKPLTWAKRLNERYSDTRNPETGLGGYQFSISVLPGIRGDRAIEQFGQQLQAHNPLEGTLSVTRQIHTIIGKAGICRMVLSESLGESGREFANSAIEDLLAYGKYSYEEATNVIHPVLTDGTRLTGLVLEKGGYYGKQGDALQAMSADALLLWSYALGFRLSKHPFLWSILRGIAKGNELGDFGADAKNAAPHVHKETSCSNPYAVFALLELYRATGHGEYLELAEVVGDNMIRQGYHHGFFVDSKDHLYAKLDSIAPLALLHLDAERKGIRQELSSYCGGSAFFSSAYDGMGHMTDQQLFYSRRR
jgi:pectate lyase